MTERVYAFEYTGCHYESAMAVMSLHRTKRGAWKAMHRFLYGHWVRAQSNENTDLHFGREWRKHRAEARGKPGPLADGDWRVVEIEVQDD